MSYTLVSRDPRSGVEARTSVPNRAQARRVGVDELDRGWELVEIRSSADAWPLAVDDVAATHARQRYEWFGPGSVAWPGAVALGIASAP